MNKNIIKISSGLAFAMLLSACTPAGINLEKQTPSFQNGAKDGCTTANGEYAKNSNLFNADEEYKNGWFHGRKTCNPSNKQ